MRELCTKLIKISPDNGNDHHDDYNNIINNTSYNDEIYDLYSSPNNFW